MTRGISAALSFIALLALVGVPGSALADVCKGTNGQPVPDRDLTATGGCLNGLPTLSQGPDGTCWAHSHAVLFESWRRCKNNPRPGPANFQASAIPTSVFADVSGERRRANQADIAACDKSGKQSQGCNGGLLTAAGASTAGGSTAIADRVMRLRDGMCNQANVGIADGGELDRLQREFRRIRQELTTRLWNKKQACDRYRRAAAPGGVSGWWNTVGATDPCPDYQSSLAEAQTWLTQQICECKATDYRVSQEVLRSANQHAGVAEFWLDHNTDYVIGAVLNQRCNGNMLTPAQISLPQLTKDQIFSGQQVNGLLDQNRVVEISFCMGVLRQAYGSVTGGERFRGLMGLLERGPRIQCAQRCGCAPHSAVIVGRVSRNGRCLYRVRNSWGADCSGHPAATRVLCDPATGDFLIPEEELDENVHTMSYY